MASLTELRAAVAARLAELDGQLVVYPSRTDYGARAGTLEKVRLTVRVLVGPEADEAGQARLDRMLAADGTGSVKGLLDGDDTLGGQVSDARVVSATGYRAFHTSSGPQLGCEWAVEIVP
jgi:hypothetical protein